MSTPSSRAAAGRAGKNGSLSGRGRGTVAVLVLLPVLLGLGIFLITQLSGEDGARQTSAAPTTAPVLGPVVPSETTTGLDPTPAASTAPAPSSVAPAPSSAASSSAAPSSAAPSPSSVSPAPVAPPAAGPTAPSPPAGAPPAAGPSGVRAAPVPAAGAGAVFGVGAASADVRTWQARMAERGWSIVVDGVFGPQSRSVAERFQAEKGLAVDGVVGPRTWQASWTAPITPP